MAGPAHLGLSRQFLSGGPGPSPSITAAGRFLETTGRVPGLVLRGDSLTASRAETPTLPTLVAAGGSLFNQTLPGVGAVGEPNDSPMMLAAYQYTNTNGTRHEFADTAIGDIDGSRSVSLDICWRSTVDAFPATPGQIVGKREVPLDNLGYELVMGADGSITAQLTGADLVSRAIGFSGYNSEAGQHRYNNLQWHNVCMHFDAEKNEFRAGTEHEAMAPVAWDSSAGSLSTATSFRVGGVRSFAAGPMQVAYVILSYGPQSVADDVATRALNLALDNHQTIQTEHRNQVPA